MDDGLRACLDAALGAINDGRERALKPPGARQHNNRGHKP